MCAGTLAIIILRFRHPAIGSHFPCTSLDLHTVSGVERQNPCRLVSDTWISGSGKHNTGVVLTEGIANMVASIVGIVSGRIWWCA